MKSLLFPCSPLFPKTRTFPARPVCFFVFSVFFRSRGRFFVGAFAALSLRFRFVALGQFVAIWPTSPHLKHVTSCVPHPPLAYPVLFPRFVVFHGFEAKSVGLGGGFEDCGSSAQTKKLHSWSRGLEQQ